MPVVTDHANDIIPPRHGIPPFSPGKILYIFFEHLCVDQCPISIRMLHNNGETHQKFLPVAPRTNKTSSASSSAFRVYLHRRNLASHPTDLHVKQINALTSLICRPCITSHPNSHQKQAPFGPFSFIVVVFLSQKGTKHGSST